MSKNKAEWLNRSLITCSIYYALCITEKAFKRELKRMNVPRNEWPEFIATPQSNATTYFFECDNKQSAIVTIGEKEGIEIEQIYALLVHEGVHIWQRYLKDIGEREPSEEFEAYSIQAISQSLMYSYKEQTSGKGKKK